MTSCLAGFKEALYDYTSLGPPIRNSLYVTQYLKETVHPKMKILTHVVTNMYGFISSSEHKKRKYLEGNLNCFCPCNENQWGSKQHWIPLYDLSL